MALVVAVCPTLLGPCLRFFGLFYLFIRHMIRRGCISKSDVKKLYHKNGLHPVSSPEASGLVGHSL